MGTMWKWLPTTTAGAIAFTLTATGASAFFPPLPLSSGDPVTISVPPAPSPILVIPQGVPPIMIEPAAPLPVPIVPPPPFVPPPPPNVPQVVPPPCPVVHPQSVPEPATIVSGLIGLGVVGAIKRRRRTA